MLARKGVRLLGKFYFKNLQIINPKTKQCVSIGLQGNVDIPKAQRATSGIVYDGDYVDCIILPHKFKQQLGDFEHEQLGSYADELSEQEEELGDFEHEQLELYEDEVELEVLECGPAEVIATTFEGDEHHTYCSVSFPTCDNWKWAQDQITGDNSALLGRTFMVRIRQAVDYYNQELVRKRRRGKPRQWPG
eukprot:TRINITY_DN66866_c1_g1_i1.p1 TRINITY_DN66866_c1_g1~~TRINITY_DN66866_c1_g1_i1.p1  ORF type:complete len:191 (+),score=10.97 TRINITY_DN66866_c1_g1_i1:94-666(+)